MQMMGQSITYLIAQRCGMDRWTSIVGVTFYKHRQCSRTISFKLTKALGPKAVSIILTYILEI